jgi:hypothetical protein
MSPVIEEVGRIIYSNSTVTINLAWGLAAALGLGLCEYSPICPRPVEMGKMKKLKRIEEACSTFSAR